MFQHGRGHMLPADWVVGVSQHVAGINRVVFEEVGEWRVRVSLKKVSKCVDVFVVGLGMVQRHKFLHFLYGLLGKIK